jgi:hypothetical protein
MQINQLVVRIRLPFPLRLAPPLYKMTAAEVNLLPPCHEKVLINAICRTSQRVCKWLGSTRPSFA